MFNTKTKADVAVTPISELNPELGKLTAQRDELAAERTALQGEDLDLARAHDGLETATLAREARVAEILGHRTSRPIGRTDRRVEIAQRLRDLSDALEIVDRRITTERSRASALAQERLAPEYQRLVGDLCKSLGSVHTALIAINGLRAKVEDAGLSSSWMAAHYAKWLDVGRHGTIGAHLHEMRQAGLISEREIPAELRA